MLRFIYIMIMLQSVQATITTNLDVFNSLNNVIKMTIELIRSCFINEKSSIILSGEIDQRNFFIIKNMFSSVLSMRMIGLDETDLMRQGQLIKDFRVTDDIERRVYTARCYVVVTSSDSKLFSALTTLRNSILWTNERVFLIINLSLKDYCKSAREFLHIVWSFNILSAIFLCSNSNGQLQLYTFNPFISSAPEPWNLVESNDVQNNHVWSLFLTNFTASNFLSPSKFLWCRRLRFDKTGNLGGYVIQGGLGMTRYFRETLDFSKKGIHQLRGLMANIPRLIWTRMNATVNVTFYSSMCLFNHKDKICDFFKDVILSKYDYSLNCLSQRYYWKHITPYIIVDGLCICAPMEKRNIIAKLMSVFPTEFWTIIILSGFLSSLILRRLLKESMISAFLEFLRLITNMPCFRLPKYQVQRFLFTIVILLFLGLNSYFQSRLNTMTTVPEADPAIDSIEDLEKSNLLVYGHKDFKEFVGSPEILNRFVAIQPNENCLHRVKVGGNRSCIMSCTSRYAVNESKQIHMAKSPIGKYYMVFYARPDWPLLPKVNALILAMHEYGIILFLRRTQFRNYTIPHYSSAPVFIDMRRLQLVFNGFTCALIFVIFIFFMEIFVKKIRPTKKLDMNSVGISQ